MSELVTPIPMNPLQVRQDRLHWSPWANVPAPHDTLSQHKPELKQGKWAKGFPIKREAMWDF